MGAREKRSVIIIRACVYSLSLDEPRDCICPYLERAVSERFAPFNEFPGRFGPIARSAVYITKGTAPFSCIPYNIGRARSDWPVMKPEEKMDILLLYFTVKDILVRSKAVCEGEGCIRH